MALFQLAIDLPLWHLRRIKQWVGGRHSYPLSLIMVEMMGHIVGPFALWKSRRRVKREGRSNPCFFRQSRENYRILKSNNGGQAIVNSSPVP